MNQPLPERRLIVLLALLILGATLLSGCGTSTVVRIPDLVGKSEARAFSIAQKTSFRLIVAKRAANTPKSAGVVVSQSPGAEDFAPAGSIITVVMAPRRAVVPEVEGRPLDEATLQLGKANLTVGKVTREYSTDYGENFVVSQHPEAWTTVPKGRPVNLVVSRGSWPLVASSPTQIVEPLDSPGAIAQQRQDNLLLIVRANKTHYRVGELVSLIISARNLSDQPAKLTFPSTQAYDFTITDSGGRIVWRWSAQEAFLPLPVDRIIDPGGYLSFNTIWPQRDTGLNMVPAGRYRVEGRLASPATGSLAIDIDINP